MEVKQPTTYSEQIEILKNRGCCIENEEKCKAFISRVNYYRLTAYFLPFKEHDDKYISGTSLEQIFSIYDFDRKLRNIIFSVVEEIEIGLRAQLAYYHAHKYGSEGYTDPGNFDKKHNHAKFVGLYSNEIENNKKVPFVKHHIEKYEGHFPIWVIIDLFSFGMLSRFYADLKREDRKIIAKSTYRTTDTNVISWLRCCTDIRNICAHYGRLYYRIFPAIPATPNGLEFTLGRTLFDNIMVLKFLHPDYDSWKCEFIPALTELIEAYSGIIRLSDIGFPEDWRERLMKKDDFLWLTPEKRMDRERVSSPTDSAQTNF